jgi:hypothetical protein
MKKMISVLCAVIAVVSIEAQADKKPPAKPAKPLTIDCSKAGSEPGLVKIKTVGFAKKLTENRAVEVAMECFMKFNPKVKAAVAKAVETSKNEYEDRPACGILSKKLELITLESWVSGRGSMSEVDGVLINQSGGSYTKLARQNVECDGIGSGLFGGVTASANVIVEVEEYYQFPMDEGKELDHLNRQELTLTVKSIVDIK